MVKRVKSEQCALSVVHGDFRQHVEESSVKKGSNSTMATENKEKNKFGAYDPAKMSETLKSGLETASNINKMSLEMLSSIAKLQTSFVKQMIGEASGSCKNYLDLNKIQDQFKMSSEKIRENVEKNISHGKQIAEMITSTGSQIVDLLKTRFNDSMEKFKTASARKN
ncbi:MAG: TIGR01841 family phasin [Holosporales bacterium]|jgi:phasin family protein|nr:TIGR01841 family phasin [Holosporales bacterium]